VDVFYIEIKLVGGLKISYVLTQCKWTGACSILRGLKRIEEHFISSNLLRLEANQTGPKTLKKTIRIPPYSSSFQWYGRLRMNLNSTTSKVNFAVVLNYCGEVCFACPEMGGAI